MLEKIKTCLTEAVLKRVAPIAAANIVAIGTALLAAHQGVLESWGITYGVWPLNVQVSGQVILIELDTLSKMALITFGGVFGAGIAAAVHYLIPAPAPAQMQANVPAKP